MQIDESEPKTKRKADDDEEEDELEDELATTSLLKKVTKAVKDEQEGKVDFITILNDSTDRSMVYK